MPDEKLSFEEYAEFVQKQATQRYTKEIPYCVLGLVGEAGEFVKEHEDMKRVLELGDVAWYAVRILNLLKQPVTFIRYNSYIDSSYLLLEVSDVAELTKKFLRGNKVEEQIVLKLNFILYMLDKFAYECGGWTINEVLYLNQQKLLDRAKNGKKES